MKYLLTPIFLSLSFLAFTQDIVPGSSAIDKTLVKPASYKMSWSAVSGSEKREIGETKIDIVLNDETLIIIQEVFLKNTSAKWIDTTVAKIGSLVPVYHSSSNMMRDMALNFGPGSVTGSYVDKRQSKTTVISDIVKEKYFDSNVYPYLIAWLPLKEGYQATIPVYNYSDASTHGILNVRIESVKELTYKLQSGESVVVYEVTVKDPISNNSTQYFIGKNDRKIYQIDAQTPRGMMQMVRVN